MKNCKQLRITLKPQFEGGVYDSTTGTWAERIELPPLGFAQVYEPHLKTFAKKQDTQDRWAYGEHYYNEAGLVVQICRRWNWVPAEPNDPNRARRQSEVVETEEIVAEHLQPRIIDNDPVDGFRLQQSVSRYSTSNKLWRVLDPRGFELEISTSNLEELMMGCVIDHGLIMGTCVWVGKTLRKI